jgi:hypothetical protein
VQIERVKLGLVKAREGLGSDGLAARAGWVERLFDKKRNFKNQSILILTDFAIALLAGTAGNCR